MNHQTSRDYLAARLIEGARLLNDLFEDTINKKVNPRSRCEELLQKYEVTPNQRSYLDKVVSRLEMAREIIRQAEVKYRLDNYGTFKRANSLFKDVFKERPPQDFFAASSHQIAIEFELPRLDYVSQKTRGYTKRFIGTFWDDIDGDLCIAIENSLIPESLVFRKRDDLPLLDMFSVQRHELKHVIDNLLGGDHCPLREVSAYLYEGHITPSYKSVSSELKRDIEKLERSRRDLQKILEKRKNQLRTSDGGYTHLEKIVARDEIYLDRLVKELRIIRIFPSELIESSIINGLRMEVSYIIPTTPISKLEGRLRLVSEAFANHNL